MTRLGRVKACGRVLADREAGAAFRVREVAGARHAAVGGVQSCGSVWACPCCSAKIARERQAELEQALTAATAMGWRVVMWTGTLRHRSQHRLTRVWGALSGAWAATTSGSGWKADQAVYGVPYARVAATGRRRGQVILSRRLPTVRVVEVNHGANGWHVHVHALLLVPGDFTDDQAADLGASMFTRWADGAEAAGLPRPSQRRGYQVQLLKGDPAAAMGDYFTKAVYSASMEVTHGQQSKAPKQGNVTPFMLLDRFVRTGDLDDLDTWHEWEAGSRGRRQFAWSPGLRILLGVGVERTDEEIAGEELEARTVARLDAEPWYRLSHYPAVICDVLEGLERSDAEGLERLARWLWQNAPPGEESAA